MNNRCTTENVRKLSEPHETVTISLERYMNLVSANETLTKAFEDNIAVEREYRASYVAGIYYPYYSISNVDERLKSAIEHNNKLEKELQTLKEELANSKNVNEVEPKKRFWFF